MLDINLIRTNPDLVKDSTAKKQMDPSLVDKLLEIDQQYRDQLQQVETLRAERNTLTKDNQDRGKQIKQELKNLEPQLNQLEDQILDLQNQIPNLIHPETPPGQGEKDNLQHRIVGEIPKFNFPPKDHLELGKELDLIDFEAGAKVSGSQFYYLKNEAVILEFALIQYALETLIKEGFTPFMTPDLARSRYYLGTGYQPRGNEAQIYEIKNQDLGLIATAEVTMAGYHADEILKEENLPKKYVAVSHCFRQEAGAYGKFSKGLYRVHQFTKVEMFAYTTPSQSNQMHLYFLEMEEKLWHGLGIPYRVLEMCDADLGAMAVRKFDLEAWMPGKGKKGEWGEVTSTSNCTDYQSRNLNIKYRPSKNNSKLETRNSKPEYLHMLNGTAIPTSTRAIIAILENYQQSDGSVIIPEVLRKWVGKDKIQNRF
jgi:seryl-tRNA synthetase